MLERELVRHLGKEAGDEALPPLAAVCAQDAGEISRTATQRCLEILGGLGITRDYLVEKWFRDCRITDIYEGTGQVQRLIIARDLIGGSFH